MVDTAHCFGCGLCITECPTGAIELKVKSPGEINPPPLDDSEWRERRALSRKNEASNKI
jgi:ferredoxin